MPEPRSPDQPGGAEAGRAKRTPSPGDSSIWTASRTSSAGSSAAREILDDLLRHGYRLVVHPVNRRDDAHGCALGVAGGMGRYDDISDERLKAELTRFARLVLRMEEEGVLLDRTASIQRLLGELRRMVFAFEVRNTRRDQEPRMHPRTRMERLREQTEGEGADHLGEGIGESLRVVQEAIERERELMEGLEDDEGADEGDEPGESR